MGWWRVRMELASCHLLTGHRVRRLCTIHYMAVEGTFAPFNSSPYLQKSDRQRSVSDYVRQWMEFRSSGTISLNLGLQHSTGND